MKPTLFAIAVVIGVQQLAFAQQPLVLDMDKTLWKLDAGGLYNTYPDGNEALAFTFRTWHGYNGWWDGYLAQKQSPRKSFLTTQTLTIHLRVTTLTGAPYFRYDSEPGNNCGNGCCVAANFRPYFTSGPIYGADLTRWWARPDSASITLVSPTDATLTVSFDPATWSSVNGGYGSDHLTEFNYSLSNVLYIGATMGGGCFYGHGVTTDDGTAMLELLSYEIN